MAIERDFDVSFIAKLTAEEKQIQQNYRPVIGVHKWFARRPGALFRGLLLAEFTNGSSLREKYFESHSVRDITVVDPFMGGGTTLFEANRIGCNVLGLDINPMAFWVVRQELRPVDREKFLQAAETVVEDVEREVGDLYATQCKCCGEKASVKYFFWVKQQSCGGCKQDLDLFPGYLIAENSRHTHYVLHCPGCRELIEVEELPAKGESIRCHLCSHAFDSAHGPAARNRYRCGVCGHEGRYPAELRLDGPPRHRLFGMEYFCEDCKGEHAGRFFKTADETDLNRFRKATRLLEQSRNLRIPEDAIPDGDETKRLHRWGYSKYREMFNERQLLSLGLLLKRIEQVKDVESRHALATVFSDSLRYQNMLCRYDSYALKCQDIFAVHGFPVGLIECENNVLGIRGVGSGSFRHFVEKYARAKTYCERPFETCRDSKGRKRLVEMRAERIEAEFVSSPQTLSGQRKAFLASGSIEDLELRPGSVDAVFTDPPYFDNVQYAELMDFCYAWLRLMLKGEVGEFGHRSTRSMRELTGNATLGRDLAHFTEGLAGVFSKAAKALKPGGPFAFTYHHNDIEAYAPVVVAILDAGLVCTSTLACPAEMTASLHINGTGSSVVDSIIVCRARVRGAHAGAGGIPPLADWLINDRKLLKAGGVECSRGDLLCLAMGHVARCVVNTLRSGWRASASVTAKLEKVTAALRDLVEACDVDGTVSSVLSSPLPAAPGGRRSEPLQAALFD